MATIVLSAAGMALGGSFGGSILGLSMAAVGRAAGAAIGRRIDQSLLGSGSASVEMGRVDRFRLAGASEGDPLTQVYGRMRVPGHIIWASQFQESTETHGGGKGGPPKPKTTAYSYSISIAIALCPGEIARVGRVWADGEEVKVNTLNMRVYSGTESQLPDPKIEAIEGAGNVPAYRGLAYVVIEDLELAPFGNRVPQLNFEVHRPVQDGTGLGDVIQGVAMIPGTGEYALATQAVMLEKGYGEHSSANMNNTSGEADFISSLDALEGELPRAQAVSLVVSWFGDDLRVGQCKLHPKVEQNATDGSMPWTVAGYARTTAGVVPIQNGRPVYGGTPADASVVQGLKEMNRRNMKVTFYPFILMEQMDGNDLPDPYSGTIGQPVLPWRGRITTERAPGVTGTSDGTAAARDEVDAFFDGPNGFDAFILHYAHLCANAGGVDAFCIGSELRGITEIRDHQGYPAVERLKALAAKVREILPEAKLGYAADWSEYHGHQPIGTNDKIFHLDPLWADENIDFVGIDNYMPLSDWRDGTEHADAHWGDVNTLDYLQANVAGGELFDWYYHSEEARAAQIRTPITDSEGEPWVWRQKDLRGWWENHHHNRINGQRSETATAWVPGLKPIWFTEYGCAAIDRGTNQPNKFLDPKSSESLLPYASRGYRDEFNQFQYLQAMASHFGQEEHNPVHPETGNQMVDMSHGFVWAWDGRPWPAFPDHSNIWSDGENYERGHWLNGRATAQPLSAVVAEICRDSGVLSFDTSGLRGMVRGYSHAHTASGREALQPLMMAYGFDAVERDGVLRFVMRAGAQAQSIDPGDMALSEQGSGLAEVARAGEVETSGRVRLGYIDGTGAYDVRTTEAASEDAEGSSAVTGSEISLVMTSGEAKATAERWLTESRLARSSINFALPPSQSHLGAGDVVHLEGSDWRIDRVESAGARQIEATRVDGQSYAPIETQDEPRLKVAPKASVPVVAEFLDLPLLRGDEVPHAPYVAFGARPWPGPVALQTSVDDNTYGVDQIAERAATIGLTLNALAPGEPGIWDRGEALLVQLVHGNLSSRSQADVLAGANLAAIGDGETWEVIQFKEAELVGDRTYALRGRLRGQGGTDDALRHWADGSRFVLLNSNLRQVDLSPQARGVTRHYRWGPADRPSSDVTWQHKAAAFAGGGLRPYPVAHLRFTGDQATWLRRTRIEGDSWDGFDVPLGEEREAYLVRLHNAGQLLRETVVTEPKVNLSPGEADALEVAQLSATFGAGPFRRIAL